VIKIKRIVEVLDRVSDTEREEVIDFAKIFLLKREEKGDLPPPAGSFREHERGNMREDDYDGCIR